MKGTVTKRVFLTICFQRNVCGKNGKNHIKHGIKNIKTFKHSPQENIRDVTRRRILNRLKNISSRLIVKHQITC